MIKFKLWKYSCQACKLCQAVSSRKAETNALLINSTSATTPTTFERTSFPARVASIKCSKYQRKDILAVRSVLMILFRPLIMLFVPLPFSPNGTIYIQPVSFSASYLAVVHICIWFLFLSALVISPLIRIVLFPPPSASVILWWPLGLGSSPTWAIACASGGKR